MTERETQEVRPTTTAVATAQAVTAQWRFEAYEPTTAEEVPR